MSAKKATPIPEARQCQDPESHHFGSVAVATDFYGHKWGVFNPNHGGHWEADDNLVGDWAVLVAAPVSAEG